jgi:preprotein translocase subunit SecE
MDSKMSDSKTPQQTDRKKAKPGFARRVALYFSNLGKRLVSFLVSMKAEIKRIMWPDRKRLIQSTATVLAIVVIAAAILFVVDSVLGGVLEAVGFYTPVTSTQDPAAEAAASAIDSIVEELDAAAETAATN